MVSQTIFIKKCLSLWKNLLLCSIEIDIFFSRKLFIFIMKQSRYDRIVNLMKSLIKLNDHLFYKYLVSKELKFSLLVKVGSSIIFYTTSHYYKSQIHNIMKDILLSFVFFVALKLRGLLFYCFMTIWSHDYITLMHIQSRFINFLIVVPFP